MAAQTEVHDDIANRGGDAKALCTALFDDSYDLVVAEHRHDAEYVREHVPDIRIVALAEQDWRNALPTGRGRVLLLDRAWRIAGDLRALGVGECWGADSPPPYNYVAELLEERAKAANYAVGKVEMRELWKLVTDRARLLNDVPPTGHRDLSTTSRQPATTASVLDRWRREGPLKHEPTGIAKLDELTGGGPCPGSRFYVGGAPDAGKTALLMQIVDTYLQRGIAVGLLAIDEEPGDLVQRLLQRRGWSRQDCERRDPVDIDAMQRQLASMPLRLYDSTWTIEDAGQDLAEFARRNTNGRAFFGVDSIQTARCEREEPAGTLYGAVTARVQAVRAIADRHRMIVAATSELSRAAYRSVDAGDRVNDLAAAKESGAIEYSARVLLVLRNVPNESDVVELRIAKNKLGPRTRDDEPGIRLRLDRARQILSEAIGTTPRNTEDIADARAAAKDRLTIEDAARVAEVVAQRPGIAAKKCESAVSNATPGKLGHRRFALARDLLGHALVESPGRGMEKLLHLDGSLLSPAVLNEVQVAHRPQVAAARPPDIAPGRPESPPVAPGAIRTTPERVSPPSPYRGGGDSRGACLDCAPLATRAPGATGCDSATGGAA